MHRLFQRVNVQIPPASSAPANRGPFAFYSLTLEPVAPILSLIFKLLFYSILYHPAHGMKSPFSAEEFALYQEYWGLSEKPFENTPDPRFLYKSPAITETFAKLLYALKSNRGGVLLTGESGCGKTLMTRALIGELAPDETEVALLTSPSPTPTLLLREILYQIGGVDPSDDHTEIVHQLNGRLYDNFSTGKNTVVIIDEGQLLEETALFEEIRLLLNFQLNDAFLLTLLLVGQPAMAERVRELTQLDDRLSARGILRPLERRDVGAYIDHRMRIAGRDDSTFSPEAVELISQYCGGIPRRLNHICDLCLVLSFSRQVDLVDEEMAERVVLDEENSRV